MRVERDRVELDRAVTLELGARIESLQGLQRGSSGFPQGNIEFANGAQGLTEVLAEGDRRLAQRIQNYFLAMRPRLLADDDLASVPAIQGLQAEHMFPSIETIEPAITGLQFAR